MSDPDYQSITNALQRLDTAADAAECHGAISAVVCLLGATGFDTWLAMHFPQLQAAAAQGDALAKEAQALLSALYQSVVDELGNGRFSYHLFMPMDDTTLEERADALGHWCQGFLLGLRYSGVTDTSRFSGELAEILADITEISQVSSVALDNTEEEERSYAELVEYLRVGVMLFNETLQSRKEPPGSKSVH